MSDEQQVNKTDIPPVGKPAEADVQIQGDGSGTEDSVAALPIGRPPLTKIFYGVLAVIATAMLWFTAGGIKKQACIDELVARYPSVGLSAKSASLNANTLKGHLKECSDSPF